MKRHTAFCILWFLFLFADCITFFMVPRSFREQWYPWAQFTPGSGYFLLAQFNGSLSTGTSSPLEGERTRNQFP